MAGSPDLGRVSVPVEYDFSRMDAQADRHLAANVERQLAAMQAAMSRAAGSAAPAASKAAAAIAAAVESGARSGGGAGGAAIAAGIEAGADAAGNAIQSELTTDGRRAGESAGAAAAAAIDSALRRNPPDIPALKVPAVHIPPIHVPPIGIPPVHVPPVEVPPIHIPPIQTPKVPAPRVPPPPASDLRAVATAIESAGRSGGDAGGSAGGAALASGIVAGAADAGTAIRTELAGDGRRAGESAGAAAAVAIDSALRRNPPDIPPLKVPPVVIPPIHVPPIVIPPVHVPPVHIPSIPAPKIPAPRVPPPPESDLRAVTERLERAYKVSLSRAEIGKMSGATAEVYRQMADAAATAFNTRLRQRIQTMPRVSADDAAWLSGQWKRTGEDAGRHMSGGFGASFKAGMANMLAGGMAMFGASQILAQVQDWWAAADRMDAAARKLGGTARQTGVDLKFLEDTAAAAKEEFGLSIPVANNFTVELAKLTAKAGDVKLTGAAIGNILDLGADRGLSTEQSLMAVGQAILGIDEGTDKLFGKNPSVLYEEYADKIGVAASKLDDQAKAAAILDAVMTAGEKSRGAYLTYLESDAGKADQAAVAHEELKAAQGEQLAPLRDIWGDVVFNFTALVGGLAAALQGLIWLAAKPINFVINIHKRMTGQEGSVGNVDTSTLDYSNDALPFNPAEDPFWKETFERNQRAAAAEAAAADAERGRQESGRLAAKEAEEKRKKDAEAAAKKEATRRRQEAEAAQRRREQAERELDVMTTDARVVGRFSGAGGRPFAALEAIPSTQVRGAVAQVVGFERDIRELVSKIAQANGASQELVQAIANGTAPQEVITRFASMATPEIAARLTALTAARGEAEGAVRRLLDNPENLVPEKLSGATRQMDELTASFEALGEMGVTSLTNIPEAFTQSVAAVEGINSKLKQTEERIRAVEDAGGTATPAALAYRDALIAQRDEAAAAADALVPLASILEEMPAISAALFEGLDAAQVTAVQQVMQDVAIATRDVAAAERELRLAEMEHGEGSRAYRQAEAALARAREKAAEQTKGLADALRAAGLSGAQLDRVLGVVTGKMDSLGVKARGTRKDLEEFGKLVDDFNRVTDAILGLADALGLTESRGAKALRGLQDFANGAAATAKAYASGDVVGMITGGIQTVTGAIKIGQALFGPNEEAKKLHEEQMARQRETVQALEALREQLLNNVSTEQAKADISQIDKAAGVVGGHHYLHEDGSVVRRREVLREAAVQMGLAGRDTDKNAAIDSLAAWARDIDSRYETNLVAFIENSDPEGFLEALQALPPAMREAMGSAGEFANTFRGIWDRINFEFAARGNADPVEKVRAFVAGLREAGINLGEFTDEVEALAALDMSTEAGRAERDRIIDEIMASMAGADFGGLTPEEMRELILMITGSAGTGGGGGPGTVDGGPDSVARMNTEMTVLMGNTQLLYMATQTDLLQTYLPYLALLGNAPGTSLSAASALSAVAGGEPTIQVVFEAGAVEFALSQITPGAEPLDVTRVVGEFGRGLGEGMMAQVNTRLAGAGATGRVHVTVHAGGL